MGVMKRPIIIAIPYKIATPLRSKLEQICFVITYD